MKISTKTLLKLTIAMAIILLAISVIYCARAEKIAKQNQELVNTVKQLDLELGIKNIELKDLRDELTGAYQLIESLEIGKAASGLYVEELEDRYLSIYSYANIAEELLLANDIDFRKAE